MRKSSKRPNQTPSLKPYSTYASLRVFIFASRTCVFAWKLHICNLWCNICRKEQSAIIAPALPASFLHDRWDAVNCLECGTENPVQLRTCTKCSAALQPARALHYLDLAEAYINKGEYDQASEYLSKADQVMLALSGNEREQYLLSARAFRLQSCIHYGKGNMDRAKEELLDAQRGLEGKSAGSMLLADVLNRLGNIAYYEGNSDSALANYQRSADIAIHNSGSAIAAKAISNMGNVYVSLGEIDVAASYYSRGLVYAEQSGSVVLAQSYSILTWLHSNYGPFSLALDYAAKAFALAGEIENLDTRTLTITQVAAAHLKYGNLEQAEQYLREAYSLVQRTGNRLVEEQVLAELAELLRQKDDYEAWQSYVIKAFRASATSPLLRKESALQLIIYYIKQQDIDRARRVLQSMKSSHEQTGSLGGREAALINQAAALLDTVEGSWQRARQHFELAINSGTLTRYELAIIWQDYATMLCEQDKHEPDREIYVKAFDAVERAVMLMQQLGLSHRSTALAAILPAQTSIPQPPLPPI